MTCIQHNLRTNRFTSLVSCPINTDFHGKHYALIEASGKRSMNERGQFIDTAYGSSLECAACLDVLAVRHAQSTQDVTHGKGLLADAVRMLVASERSLEEE